MDLAPGYRHKGVCRAGFLALDGNGFEDTETPIPCDKGSLSNFDLERKGKRIKVHQCEDDSTHQNSISSASKFYDLWKQGFSYDIKFLASFLDKERDHYNSPWSPGNCIGQRELREWLSKLWYEKPAIRELIWKVQICCGWCTIHSDKYHFLFIFIRHYLVIKLAWLLMRAVGDPTLVTFISFLPTREGLCFSFFV